LRTISICKNVRSWEIVAFAGIKIDRIENNSVNYALTAKYETDISMREKEKEKKI